MPMPASAHQPGFTLIELIVFIVVIGVALSGVLLAVNQATSHSADPMVQIRAAELGQAYLDEILPRKFDANTGNDGQSPPCGAPGAAACSTVLGPEAGETRATYDDVDDYQGLNEAPLDAEGNPRPGYTGYQVVVSVAYAGADLGLGNTAAKRITVTVTTPQGDSSPFSVYRSNF